MSERVVSMSERCDVGTDGPRGRPSGEESGRGERGPADRTEGRRRADRLPRAAHRVSGETGTVWSATSPDSRVAPTVSVSGPTRTRSRGRLRLFDSPFPPIVLDRSICLLRVGRLSGLLVPLTHRAPRRRSEAHRVSGETSARMFPSRRCHGDGDWRPSVGFETGERGSSRTARAHHISGESRRERLRGSHSQGRATNSV